MSKPFDVITPSHVLSRDDLNSTSKLLYSLLKFRQGNNHDSYWGLRGMAKDMGLSKGAIQYSIDKLEKSGLVEIEHGDIKSKGSEGSTNRYRIKRTTDGTLCDSERTTDSTGTYHILDDERTTDSTKKTNTKDKPKDKGEKPVSASSKTKPQEVVDYWNAKAQDGKLPKIHKLTQDRKKRLNARLKDSDFAEGYPSIIDRIFTTPFLTGENGRRWKAGFDWLIRSDDNPVKVMEGFYDGNGSGVGSTTPSIFKHRNITEDEKKEFLYSPEDSQNEQYIA